MGCTDVQEALVADSEPEEDLVADDVQHDLDEDMMM